MLGLKLVKLKIRINIIINKLVKLIRIKIIINIKLIIRIILIINKLD